jgi:hypothetical protein
MRINIERSRSMMHHDVLHAQQKGPNPAVSNLRTRIALLVRTQLTRLSFVTV